MSYEEDVARWLVEELRWEYDQLISRQGRLLTDTVNVLRGPPPPLTTWSHHDVAELAADLVEIRKRLDYTLKKLADGAGRDWAELIEEGYLEEGDLL